MMNKRKSGLPDNLRRLIYATAVRTLFSKLADLISEQRDGTGSSKLKIMKNILITSVLAFFIVACSQTHSEGVDSNSSTPSVTPPAKPMSNSAMPPADPPAKPIVEGQPVNKADCTVAKFDYAKMRVTTLDTQPLEIIKKIAAFDPEHLKQSNPSADIKEELKAFDRYKIKTAEDDLNHDGISERIIISRGETGGEVELLDIFTRKNDQWNSIFVVEGDPDEPKVPRLEILTSSAKNGFDLIKTIAETGADNNSQKVGYYRMQNEQYEAVDCYFAEGKTKESVSCN